MYNVRAIRNYKQIWVQITERLNWELLNGIAKQCRLLNDIGTRYSREIVQNIIEPKKINIIIIDKCTHRCLEKNDDIYKKE